MKTGFLYILFVVAFFMSSNIKSFAQQHADKSKDSSAIDFSVDYKSNNVYSGRSDSLSTAYLSPSITYTASSGIYLSATASYFAGESRIDLFEVEGGYAFDRKKWNGNLSVTKYFYNRNSYNISSAIAGVIDASFKFPHRLITPMFSSYINLGKIPDVGCTIGIEKKFYAFDDNLEIIPSFNINSGTQHYYNSYYTNRKRKKNSGNFSTSIAGAGHWRITDLQVECPLYYYWKNFDLHFTPTYCVPVKPNTILVKDKTTSSSTYAYKEQLRNIFYWSAGITYTR